MKRLRRGLLVAAAGWLLLANAGAAQAQFSGAIYTSLADGTVVNQNIYDAREDVYLNGGPQNENSAGLPDGTYYYQVTSPSGILLSSDPASNRQLLVIGGVVKGPAPGSTHLAGSLNPVNGSIPVELYPFSLTPNAGGEYKVWLIMQTETTVIDEIDNRVIHFAGGDTKTDNFKVKETEDPENPNATISGVKYYDANTNGIRDPNEITLAGWQIQVTVDTDGDGPNEPVAVVTSTDADGVWALVFPEGSTFEICEVPVLNSDHWIQTGPLKNIVGDPGTDADRCWVGTVDADGVDGLDFGNVCLGAGGGMTLGFWSNKNGKTVFDQIGGLAVVNALNLANATGPQGDFASYAEFRTWLLNGTAVNMSYMLSVQMAAMALNVAAGSWTAMRSSTPRAPRAPTRPASRP